MTWNYRILDFGTHYALHEVYYDDTGVPDGYTASPITFVAEADEDPNAIAEALEMALNDARTRPVLKAASISGQSLRPID